jgi:hypothetical protein
LKKSRDQVQELHRFHLLQWAEIETREMTREAKSKVDLTGRVESAQHAIDVIDTALGYYENERTLIESRAVILELLASIRVSDLVERAERSVFNGDYAEARSLYRDALFFLGRDNIYSEHRASAAAHINDELLRIEQLQSSENRSTDGL